MSYDDTSGAPTEHTAGDAAPDQVAQIRSADQIDETTRPWFEPEYDSVPDDTSWAEVGPQV